MRDGDAWDDLGANLVAYGGLFVVGGFLLAVPSFVAIGGLFGALDWLLFGGMAGLAMLLWLRFSRWCWPPRSLRARARIGRTKHGRIGT